MVSTAAAGGLGVSDNECNLCHRDLSAGALVRCREPRCPAKASRRQASIVVFLGLAGIAILTVAVIGAIWLLSKGRKGSETAGGAIEGLVAAGNRPDSQGGGEAGPAIGGSLSAGGPETGEAVNAGQAPADQSQGAEAADPRAAALVQSFSCATKLSASRVWICTHWSLATMDYNLSLQYKSALARSKNPQSLRKAHAAWLAEVDLLEGDAARLLRSYRQWRDQLSKN